MVRPRQQFLTLAAFLGLLCLTGAALYWFSLRPVMPAAAKPQVAATIFPLYDIVRNVAGNDAEVSLILPPAAEPHSFEPQPSVIRTLSTVSVVYAIGHGIDDWVDPVLASGTAKVVVDRGIPLRAAPEAVALGDEEEEAHGAEDPHYWLSVPNAMRILDTVESDLVTRFPAHAANFHANATAYRARLAALDMDIRTMLAAPGTREMVTFHDAWAYFAAEYGLRIAGTFEPAPGREPTPRGLAALRQAVEASTVRTLYTEPLFSDAAISAFAIDQNLGLAQIDDIGGVPGRDSYEALLRYNAHIISQNQ